MDTDTARRLVEAAVLQDRERISRELHDGAIQQLYGVALSLEAILRGGRGEPASARLRQLREVVLDAAENIRRYVDDLAGDAAGTRLVEQLRRLVSEAGPSRGLRIALDLDRSLDDLPPAMAHEVLQMAREAVSNVVRHAGASRCEVRARCDGASLSLQVSDDGRGLPVDAPHQGHGLRNLARRSRALGGALTVRAAAGGGTAVQVRFPVPAAAAARAA
jgi:signal transduction histidine kinase